MPSLTPEDYQEWMKFRRYTLIIFVAQNLMVGLDIGFTYMTLWIYLKEVVKPDMPLLFYSVIFVSFFIPSVIFSGLISNLIDQSRNVRLVFFVINTMVLIGSVLYMLPYSPWYLVISRFMAGTGNTLRSVMAGEVARSYPVKEVPRKLSYLGIAYAMGYAGGPGLNFLFKNVEFHIFSLKVTYLNIPGLYMAVSFLLIQVFSISMLSNLSKIYDLKAETIEITSNEDMSFASSIEYLEDTTHLLNEDMKDSYTSSASKRLFSSFDIVLLFVLAFLENYIASCFYIWCPLVVLERLHWTVDALGWLNVSLGIAIMLPCILLTLYPITNRILFYVGVFAQIALLLCHIALTIQCYITNFPVNILMWVVYCSLWVILVVADEVFIVGTLAQMVSSKYQIFADGIRLRFYRMGAVIGYALSTLEFQRMDITSALHICIIAACIIMIISRRRILKNPTILIS